jgi:UDP-N-acetylbacillosamine transaminase
LSKIPHPKEFTHDEIGINYRMPNINTALGLTQIEQLDVFLKSKSALIWKYQDFFIASDLQFVTEPQTASSYF